jgi:hypothetical protein
MAEVVGSPLTAAIELPPPRSSPAATDWGYGVGKRYPRKKAAPEGHSRADGKHGRQKVRYSIVS